jgi:parallel beta-helix repeat protein
MKKLLFIASLLIAALVNAQEQRFVLENKDTLVQTTKKYNGSVPPSTSCNTKLPVTHIVGPTKPGEIYITNASTKGWKGGDTLKIPAGTYSVIEIDSFGGDPCRDIIIVNSGGLVNVTGSIRLQKDVHHVKIMGTGTPGLTYGFKCKNFSFNRANHYTMSNIEVGPNTGGVGIYGKQDPYADQPWTWYPNYVSRKITITNCYVHDVAGEGMYIGHTYPSGDPSNANLVPQRMDSVTISNCIVTNSGWDAIQVSNARDGCQIFNNTVTNFGTANIDGQRAGIILGGNTSGSVYNNTVTNGMGNGIQFFGYGKLECYGNTITNVGNTLKTVNGEESIYGQDNPSPIEPNNPKQAMVISNNMINAPKKRGAIRFNVTGNSEIANLSNNKFCFPVTPPTNWKSLYIFIPSYIDVNNIPACR